MGPYLVTIVGCLLAFLLTLLLSIVKSLKKDMSNQHGEIQKQFDNISNKINLCVTENNCKENQNDCRGVFLQLKAAEEKESLARRESTQKQLECLSMEIKSISTDFKELCKCLYLYTEGKCPEK
jgi:predicted Holliday junction resolvase-like endonuclease